MNTPRVSVIMPMYNAMPFLAEAIGSILNQTFRDFELLIVDNGSADGSLQYAASVRDERVVVQSEPARGTGKAITAGIFAARGELLAIMDADDIAHPDRLRRQVRFLAAHPEIVLVGTRFAWMVGSEILPVAPQPRNHSHIRSALLKGRPVVCNASTMFRADVARQVGGHQFPGAGHDVDFFLRMSDAGKLANMPDLLHYYRLHAASSSISNITEVNRWYAYSIRCAKARAERRKEPDFEQFSLQWDRRPFFARLAERADDKALELYRTSVVMRAKRQYMASAAASVGAALLSPRRTNWHLKRLLGLC